MSKFVRNGVVECPSCRAWLAADPGVVSEPDEFGCRIACPQCGPVHQDPDDLNWVERPLPSTCEGLSFWECEALKERWDSEVLWEMQELD